jgi:hypothetical protein
MSAEKEPEPLRDSFRLWAGVLILAVQAVFIARARFTDQRYFCWAPYDSNYEYSIAVTHGGRALSPAEIAKRYTIPQEGLNQRAIREVIDTVMAVEERIDPREGTQAEIVWSCNGGEELMWHWPRR